jgi:peptide deformylase
MGHPALAAVAVPADPTSTETRELVSDLIDTMISANGAGLAAPQIGVNLRVVVFQAPASRVDPGLSAEEAFDHTAPLTVLVNPVIEVLDADREGGWEGCLSIPAMRGWVERPAHIRYSGTGLDGSSVSRIARGFHARVVQVRVVHTS